MRDTLMSSSRPLPKTARFAALDGWRGICALLIALYHCQFAGHLKDSAFLTGAWMFVDFFFVLSGFVLAHAYEGKTHTARDVAAFMLRRFGRLWPLHATILAVFVALVLVKIVLRTAAGFDLTSNSENSARAAVASLFLVHALHIGIPLSWNMPSWSISTELWTNAVFALLCTAAARYRLVGAAALALSGLLIVAIYAPYGMNSSTDYGFFRCLYGFFTGYLTFKIFAAKPVLVGFRLASVAEVVMAAALTVYVALAESTPWSFLAPILFAAAVWLFAQEAGLLSDLLRRRPLAWLGSISYSVYMGHYLAVVLIGNFFTVLSKLPGANVFRPGTGVVSFGGVWLMDFFTLVYVVGVVGFAWLTWRFIEMPQRRAFNRMAERLAAGTPADKVVIHPLGE